MGICHSYETGAPCYSTPEKLRNIESNKVQLDGPKGKVNGFQIGDKVKHNWFDDVATITAKRQVYMPDKFGFCWLYTLDFGHSVTGPFGTEWNGEEFQVEALTLCEPTGKSNPVEIVAPVTEADKSASWETSYTAGDFQKLTTQSEVHEEDRDIIGRRFRFVSKYGDSFELQIFVQDYAGNEAHALYYIWDELMQEVQANVRSLGWLREKLTEANGWQAA